MTTKLIFLFTLVIGVTLPARADAISVDFFASPDVLPAFIAPGVPSVGAFFFANIQNLANQTVYLNDSSFFCVPEPDYRDNHSCNAAGELAIAPLTTAFFSHFGVFGAGNPPGIYTFTFDVFGGFSGANDHTLLGSDTATVTIVPELGTLMLLGTGLLGVALKARKKLFR